MAVNQISMKTMAKYGNYLVKGHNVSCVLVQQQRGIHHVWYCNLTIMTQLNELNDGNGEGSVGRWAAVMQQMQIDYIPITIQNCLRRSIKWIQPVAAAAAGHLIAALVLFRCSISVFSFYFIWCLNGLIIDNLIVQLITRWWWTISGSAFRCQCHGNGHGRSQMFALGGIYWQQQKVSYCQRWA